MVDALQAEDRVGKFSSQMPPERRQPKKRRFHPLRGLRRIFRKKSRGAADARASSSSAERDPANGGDLMSIVRDREEVTLRDPAGRADEIRSRSASELLTESCSDRDRMFLRRRGMEDSFSQLLQKGGAVVGQLSVSHDSVFPGEGSGQRSRPLSSSLEMHASLERRYVKASSASPESKEPQSTQKHRISLRVLEQIKTVIENRNQVAVAGSTATTTTSSSSSTSTSSGAATATTPEGFNSLHNRFGSRDRGERTIDNTQEKLPRKDTSSSSSILDDSGVSLKEDLPELPTGNLSHTAAHHRISVRPKNRRPPRRTTPAATTTTTTTSTTTPTTPPSPTTTTTQALAGESFAVSSTSIDALDSLEEVSSANTSEELTIPSTPTTPVVVTPIVVSAAEPSKPIPILRKSSSRISRNSDVFEELDHQKVPLRPKPQQTAACSPDSLESTTQLDSRSSADVLDEATKPPRPTPRSSSTSSDKSPARRSSAASNRLSKSPDSLESGSPSEWLAKSSNEGLFEITDKEVNGGKPIPARRSLLGPPIPVSKSQERVCSASGSKSDSLEALNSDDSMERRQQHRHSSSGSIVVVGGSSFDVRPRRSQNKLMSKSTECFDTMMMISSSAEQQQLQQQIVKIDEKRKRASVSEVNLSRGGSRFPSKLLQAESFEKFAESSDKLLLPASLRRASGGITPTNNNNNNNNNSSGKRMAHSSESSDNLELDDNCKLENRRRSTPKRLSRLRKNSESSELGSTDTLDSERRNHTMKSSDSDETLDSLEKDLLEPVPVRKGKDEEEQLLQPIQHCDNIPIVAVVERRDDNADETADTKVGAFWRRKTTTTSSNQESKDDKADLDIHQLGGYLLSSKIHENGNNEKQEETSSPVLVYAKKKQMQVMQQQQQHQQQQQAQQPSGGGGVGAGSEEPTKNNQLTNKSDEEVQNMLNGNISEVTTDTRSFKEKLIMFEKLGK